MDPGIIDYVEHYMQFSINTFVQGKMNERPNNM